MTAFVWVVIAATLLESAGYVAHLVIGKPRVVTRAQLAFNIACNCALMLWGAWLLGGVR